MSRAIAAFTPAPEQLTNWTFFLGVLFGIVLALALTWLASDYGVDWIVAKWPRRRRGNVIDFSERRKLSAIVAIRGGR